MAEAKVDGIRLWWAGEFGSGDSTGHGEVGSGRGGGGIGDMELGLVARHPMQVSATVRHR